MEKADILKLTVPKLREEALKHEGITGVHGMNKPELMEALFQVFGIPPDEKVRKQFDPDVKKKLKALKLQKAEALKSGDKKKAKILKRKVHNQKRITRH